MAVISKTWAGICSIGRCADNAITYVEEVRTSTWVCIGIGFYIGWWSTLVDWVLS